MLNLKDFLQKKKESNGQISNGHQKQPTNGQHSPIDNKTAIEHCIQKLKDSNVDLTENYQDWVNIGFALASLGEEGREYFHQVSSLYANYDYKEADQKFDSLLDDYRGDIQIGTFFHYCKEHGINLPNQLPAVSTNSSYSKPNPKDQAPEIIVYSAFELLNRKDKVIPMLVDPILPRRGVAALAGSSDVGKSTFLRQVALYTVNGEERFIGFPMNPVHKRAYYVSTEDDDLAIAYLLNKQVAGLGHDQERYQNLHYIFDFGDDLLATLDEMLTAQPADLVIIDAFSDLFTGQMNHTNIVRSFINEYYRLSYRHECLIIFLHHTGKNTENNRPSKNNLLGSQGFEAKMRLVIELREDWQNPDLRHLCIVKGNYLSKDYKNASFVLRYDEHMLFHNTGDRVCFDELVKPAGSGSGNRLTPDQKEDIKRRHEEGQTIKMISEQMEIPYSTVGRIVKVEQ